MQLVCVYVCAPSCNYAIAKVEARKLRRPIYIYVSVCVLLSLLDSA